jgi:hypothetical protein
VLLSVALLALALATAGCGASGSDTGSDGASGTSGASGATGPSGAATSSDVSGSLTIVVDEGSGKPKTWTLTCDPPAGTHPDPTTACAALAKGAAALAMPAKDRTCTEIYGGPQTAKITGTWQGKEVAARITRTNGCEISRWDALRGLLPPGGG